MPINRITSKLKPYFFSFVFGTVDQYHIYDSERNTKALCGDIIMHFGKKKHYTLNTKAKNYFTTHTDEICQACWLAVKKEGGTETS